MSQTKNQTKTNRPEQAEAAGTVPGTSRPSIADTSAQLTSIGRRVPESRESEAAVLGSMILDPECIGEVVQELTTEAFYSVEHQLIFNALIRLYEKGTGPAGVDLVLLRDELKKHNELEQIGGVDYLAQLDPSSIEIIVDYAAQWSSTDQHVVPQVRLDSLLIDYKDVVPARVEIITTRLRQ